MGQVGINSETTRGKYRLHHFSCWGGIAAATVAAAILVEFLETGWVHRGQLDGQETRLPNLRGRQVVAGSKPLVAVTKSFFWRGARL